MGSVGCNGPPEACHEASVEPLASIPQTETDYSQVLKLKDQFDGLSSYLSTYLTGATPIHKDTPRHQRITRATAEQLYEISTDIYDELSRRQLNKESFLPFRCDYHPKRNDARQKLSIIPLSRFTHLLGDVFVEVARRYPEFYDCDTEDVDHWDLALSCWILRRQGHQGLKRSKHPNRYRPVIVRGHTTVASQEKVKLEDGVDAPIKAMHTSASEVEKVNAKLKGEQSPPAYTESLSSPSPRSPSTGSELTLVMSGISGRYRPAPSSKLESITPEHRAGPWQKCKRWLTKVRGPSPNTDPPEGGGSRIRRIKYDSFLIVVGNLVHSFPSHLGQH
ncbi:hypothetical protein ONZ45_g9583 [Pleurotus djamor]|nr:hypothetical protein ONZ45_g9583 [Pleurotus djamor]